MKLPYPYRGLAMLSALIVLLPAAAWRYAVSGTVRTAIECRRLRAQTAAIPAAPSDSAAFVAGTRDMLLSGLLLGHAGCDVQVTGYTPVVTDCQGALAVHTAELSMAGTFADLLHSLHRIERAAPECVVRSVCWSLAADRAAKSERLTLTLYVQQLVKTERP